MSNFFRVTAKTNIYLLILLIAATAITVFSTLLTYRNSIKAAEDFLRLHAIGIAVSLEASLKDNDELKRKRNIFKEIITEGKWEGIAFLALYDEGGVVLLHSNENLIGRQMMDDFIKAVAEKGEPVYSYLTLGTGERVFVLNYPVHIKGIQRVGKIALHTYPSERLVRQATLQMLSIAVVVIALWVMGYFFIRAINKTEHIKAIMDEREKFAVLGEMASVLAHEIRNPLGSIKGFAQYLKEQKRQDSSQKTDELDIIISESKRIETLTEDLLLYSKPVEIKSQEFNIQELIEDVLRSVNMPSKIEVKTSINDDKIQSDRDKLKQILLNLIQNSYESIKDGGKIDIKAEVANNTLLISIKDDGSGMDRETLKNAFKPFFTTKIRGTGLGLSIVEKLIKALDGKIEVESELNKGTVFTITIPVATGD